MAVFPLFSAFRRPPGPLTVMEGAAQTLLRRWVPKWHEVFEDPATGLFFERVGPAFKPILTGRRRLLSQLRQLAMYAHAVCQPENFLFAPDLEVKMHAVARLFAGDAPGVWRFAINDDLQPADDRQDLYTLAFVIFATAHYARATDDPLARTHAVATATHIDTAFRSGVDAGFAEALDRHGMPDTTLPRRHESHMHLLEACLDAAATWDDPIFMRLADELTQLFVTRLYDADKQLLSEYYAQDLTPVADAKAGRVVCEPGHYYEWVWLLKKHARAQNDPARYDATCLSLVAWANAHGWDQQHGGIYDELESDGTIISDAKRLWPLTEALKANALVMDIAPDRDGTKDFMAQVAGMLGSDYIQRRGFWTEWLTRDLQPAADYMPSTTPYHVYFGIMEARAALAARGQSKSLRLGPRKAVYAVMRNVSAMVRILKRRA